MENFERKTPWVPGIGFSERQSMDNLFLKYHPKADLLGAFLWGGLADHNSTAYYCEEF